MKFFATCSLLLIATGAFTQDCKNYFFLQDNKTVEMTIYNKKAEANGKQVYKVSDVKTNGNTTTASLASEMFNKNDKSIAKGNSLVTCTGGVFMIDMKFMLPQQQAEQFGKADAKVQNAYIEYPAAMTVGDHLKDGVMDMEVDNNGLKQTVHMEVNNRSVEAKESVTTTAGTWECFKITYKSKISIKTMGIGVPINVEGTEWYAPGFGVVKTESKNGGTAITAIK